MAPIVVFAMMLGTSVAIEPSFVVTGAKAKAEGLTDARAGQPIGDIGG